MLFHLRPTYTFHLSTINAVTPAFVTAVR